MQMPPYLKLITARAAAPLLAVLAVAGCATAPPPEPSAIVRLSATQTAQPRPGTPVTGVVRLQQRGDDVIMRGTVENLRASGSHGFYIHEKGDCSAPDASSAGPHFNPAGAPHGRAGAGAHHAGDMPNIKADAKGVAKIDQLVAGVTLAAGANGAAGRALVVHRDPDDYSSQPAGNAGPRFACGVIPAN